MFRSANPVLSSGAFANTRAASGESTMTLQGAVNKCFILLFLIVFAAAFIWLNPPMVRLLVPAAIVGFILALVTTFKREWAPVTAPLYAGTEGIVLGAISMLFEHAYPGIVIQAVILTFGTLFAMLLAYRAGLVRPTEKFRHGLFAALGGIMIVYFGALILRLFGISLSFIYGGGPIAIIFSLVVVVVAALCLILDFDLIARGAEYRVPGYMEWYAAFGLMVTLIWLYLEILRFLALTRRR